MKIKSVGKIGSGNKTVTKKSKYDRFKSKYDINTIDHLKTLGIARKHDADYKKRNELDEQRLKKRGTMLIGCMSNQQNSPHLANNFVIRLERTGHLKSYSNFDATNSLDDSNLYRTGYGVIAEENDFADFEDRGRLIGKRISMSAGASKNDVIVLYKTPSTELKKDIKTKYPNYKIILYEPKSRYIQKEYY